MSRNGGEDGNGDGEEMLFEFVVGFGVVRFVGGFGGGDGFFVGMGVLVVFFVGVVVFWLLHDFVVMLCRFFLVGRAMLLFVDSLVPGLSWLWMLWL